MDSITGCSIHVLLADTLGAYGPIPSATPPRVTQAVDRVLDPKDDGLMLSVAVKIVEHNNDGQEKYTQFSKYLRLKKFWQDILSKNEELDDDEKIRDLLIKWITDNGKNATISKLIEKLKYMGWNDIADILK